ncbi:MAG: hypothetical protein WCG97_03675 [bacterium]
MENQLTRKNNSLSIVLFILAIISPFGYGPLYALSFVIPLWKYLYCLAILALLIISCYQIFTRNEKGLIFNFVTLLNLIFTVGLYFYREQFLGVLNNLSRFNKPENTNTIFGIAFSLVVIALLTKTYQYFKNRNK